MQFLPTVFAAAAGIAATVSAAGTFILNTTASGIDINSIQTPSVSFANQTMWIGEIKYQLYSEPLINYGSTSQVFFLSYHQSATGWQEAYVYPNSTAAVAFTVAHSGYVAPPGATTVGFGVDADGYLIFNGENKFIGCNDGLASEAGSYQVYWYGGEAALPSGLNCTGTLYMYQDDQESEA
ncbi:hypothetical protein B7494_g2886 [Chlorociboria aeruginascens]|nr:hypothetical protein B7494_g2886 [Chlorociboria aeruginascens]